MTIQPARHECHACCPLQAEKPRIQPVVGNTHGTHVEQVVSSFQKILRGSQLTWHTASKSATKRMFSFFVGEGGLHDFQFLIDGFERNFASWASLEELNFF